MYSMNRAIRPCSRELGQLHQTVVVDAAFDHRVELDRPEAGVEGGGDAVQHPPQRHADVVHRREHRLVQGVQAHRHPCQAGGAQPVRLAGQQRAVGGQRQVGDALDLTEHGHQRVELAAQQRLPAGQPDLGHPQRRGGADHPGDLLERQDLGAGEERVAAAEDLLGHAVRAAEVAPIGDRDAQIPQPTTKAIHRRILPRRGVGGAIGRTGGRQLFHRAPP
jgi:hypothetical protein